MAHIPTSSWSTFNGDSTHPGGEGRSHSSSRKSDPPKRPFVRRHPRDEEERPRPCSKVRTGPKIKHDASFKYPGGRDFKAPDDPYALAEKVTRFIEKGRDEDALNLARTAPVPARTPVIWAHVVKALKDAGKGNAAWQAFNEMKKRGLSPTPATYTVILEAVSTTPSDKGVERVRAVEMTLKRRDELGIIHINALLKAYARLDNVESFLRLWAEVSHPLHIRLSPHPAPGEKNAAVRPDALTFSLAINYLTQVAMATQEEVYFEGAWDAWNLAMRSPGAHGILDGGMLFSALKACNAYHAINPAVMAERSSTLIRACLAEGGGIGVEGDVRVVWQMMVAYQLQGDLPGAMVCLEKCRARWPRLRLDMTFWVGITAMIRNSVQKRPVPASIRSER